MPTEQELLQQIISGSRAPAYGNAPQKPVKGPVDPAIPGLLERGNIDLSKRPNVPNPEAGGESSIYSMSFRDDDEGAEILIPRISDDGSVLTEDQAIAIYYATGRHLGKFDTSDNATTFAQNLSASQGLKKELNNNLLQQILQNEGRPPARQNLAHTTPTEEDRGLFERLAEAGGAVAVSIEDEYNAQRQGTSPYTEDLFGRPLYNRLSDDSWILGEREGDGDLGLPAVAFGKMRVFQRTSTDETGRTTTSVVPVDPNTQVVLRARDGSLQVYQRDTANELGAVERFGRWFTMVADWAIVPGLAGKAIHRVGETANTLKPEYSAKVARDVQVAKIAAEVAGTDIAPGVGDLTDELIDQYSGVFTARVMNEVPDMTPEMLMHARKNFEKNLKDGRRAHIVRVAKEGFGGEAVVANDRLAEQKIIDQNRVMSAKWRERLKKQLVSGIIDKSGNIKKILDRSPIGQTVRMYQELAAGSTTRGQIYFEEASKRIFHGLGMKEGSDLSKLIKYRRLIEIMKYRPDYLAGAPNEEIANMFPGMGKRPASFTMVDMEEAIKTLAKEYPEGKFLELTNRADAYFDTFRGVLKRMLDEGLIAKDEFVRLNRFDYSPIQFIDAIDPKHTVQMGKQKISVRESGVKALQKGDTRQIENDAQMLLAQAIMRVEGRIGQNRAAKAAYHMAQVAPNNGLFVAKKGQEEKDWIGLSARIGGKAHKFYVNPEFADEWTASPVESFKWLHIASGGALVRPLATGANPLFILKNFPRDISYVINYTNEFSLFKPLAYAQIAKDMAVVAKDVATRSGRVMDYIEEGGGMNLLTHQGFGTETVLNNRVGAKLNNVQKYLGYLNETSELMVRLAVRERALQNGATPEQATWAARKYIDFAQGGVWAKHMDAGMPYFNAAIQGTRGWLRYAKNDPVKFATKMGQSMSFYAGMYIWAQYMYPEVMEEVPEIVKAQNIVIPTGLYDIDANGNKRHRYVTVAIDHSNHWLKAMTDALMEKHYSGKNPSPQMLEFMRGAANTVFSGSVPPSLQFLMTYKSGYDFWNDRQIWAGPDVLPADERYQYPKEPTPVWAADIADASRWVKEGVLGGIDAALGSDLQHRMASMEISPERLKAASKQIIPENFYTSLMGFGYTVMTRGMDDATKDRVTADVVRNATGLGNVFKVTHPYSNEATLVDYIQKTRGSERVRLNAELDEIVVRSFNDQRKRADVRSWIKAQPKGEQARLMERYKGLEEFQRAIKSVPERMRDRIPSRTWWLNIRALDSKARADAVLTEWQNTFADEEGGNSSRAVIRNLMHRIPGIWSEDFRRELKLEAQRRGVKF